MTKFGKNHLLSQKNLTSSAGGLLESSPVFLSLVPKSKRFHGDVYIYGFKAWLIITQKDSDVRQIKRFVEVESMLYFKNLYCDGRKGYSSAITHRDVA